MANSNKDKNKSEVVTEIENDNTPLDKKGQPVVTPLEVTVEELLAKDPKDLSASDMDILSEHKEDLTEEQQVAVGLIENPETPTPEGEEEPVTPSAPETPTPAKLSPKPEEETEEQKEQKYRSQQAEAQIQAEKSKTLTETIKSAAQIPEPTDEELIQYVKSKGVDLDNLSDFEKTILKENIKSQKKFDLVLAGAEKGEQIDERAKEVDKFIESTDGQEAYVKLSGHEEEFRRYAMQAAHRGSSIDVLLNSFLFTLKPAAPNRGSLFNHGGGGQPQAPPTDKLTDADYVKKLKENDPKEYKRLMKLHKIKIEV